MNRILFIFFLLCCSARLVSQSSGGILSSNTVVCANSNNGVLTVNSYSGTIQRWEYALTPTGPWTPIIFTSNSYNYSNVIQSTYFRVVVQLIGYPVANSNTILVSCDQPAVSGIISTNTFQCINSPVSSTLTGSTGSVISWESSTNNWITTNTITTSNTLIATLASLTSTAQLRVRVQNGVCPFVFSNTVTVFPAASSNGGTISGTQSVCATSNASTLTLNNFTGTVQQWESATSGGGPFNTIASSANTNTISYFNLTQTTWYRAQVKNGTCPAATSPNFSVQVDVPTVGGSIVGTQAVCASYNSGTLQVLANYGFVNQWEYSNNNGITWSAVSNTLLTQNFSNITSTRIYRAVIQNGICPSALSNQFTVYVNPVPTVSLNVMNTCMLAPAQFTNYTGGTNSYVWDFGDAGSSNIYNPNHSYLIAGTYAVKLSATSSQGCTDSLKKIIVIYPNPVSSFASADTACFGNVLSFSNSSTINSGNISSFKFNFNDGSPIVTTSPVSHFFMSDGTYSVYLIATSNFGCKDSTVKRISIYPKPNTNFVAGNVCKGSAVLFNNLSFISNGGLNNKWDFGNGSLSTLTNPNYIYPTAGIFTVSLITRSNHNCSDTSYKTVSVNEKPNLLFTANNACLGAPILFGGTFAPASINVSVTLNFGDGTFSNNANISHNYLTSGTFATNLIAITDSGCVSSTSKNITVYLKPSANFNFNNVCNADSIKFNNTSSIAGGSMHYTWSFGASNTSTQNSPGYFYPLPGNYTVNLIATSNFDCSDTITKPITIFDAPKADFSFSNACNGSPVTFTNTSTVNSGVISTTFWDFGDNSSANLLNPTRDYLNNGSYQVTLICKSTNGCSDTVKKSVHVYEGPLAKFDATSQCLNSAVSFTNLSLLGSGTYSSSWRFGDGIYSEQNSPSHIYIKPGQNLVWLKTTSSNLCVDSVSRYVETFAGPKIYAGTDTTLEKGLGVTLNASGAVHFNWSPTQYLNNPTLKNPFSNPDRTVTYVVEGIDENGCKGFDTINVNINDNFLVTPFNILTPDANGLNDTWVVKNIQAYKENKVIIFDQWNQEVFKQENYDNKWEGKNKAGEILPDATYYYILTFTKSNKKYCGYITLIRNK